MENTNAAGAAPSAEMGETTSQATGAQMSTEAAPQPEGRRTQLRIVRESVDSLSNDIGSFRRKHEASIKKLDKQVGDLRSELAAQSVQKDLGAFRKSHDASSKKLEKQVVQLRNDLADLKSHIAKDAARSRAKQEAMLSRILAKVSAKPAKPAKSKKKK